MTIDTFPFPVISGYRLQKRLGSGGMATVYLATQESLDRLVSIKVTEPGILEDEVSKQRFENEARTIAKLSHSGIVGIYEVGRTNDGQMYYIMPYLANGDLSQRDLRNDEAQIQTLLRTLLEALDYAHNHGIVHRDVKDENVLFDAHDRPHLTDFGIATSKRDTSRLTSVGLSVGSSGFMAPEQARGEEVDGRADLYSVGVMTYSLLTGHLPFRASDALALALMHATDPVPKLPPDKQHWQSFIDRAMAKKPAQRFDNAQDMLQALEKIGKDKTPHSPRGLGDKRVGITALTGMLLIAGTLYATRSQTPTANEARALPPDVKTEPQPATAPSTQPPPKPADTAKPDPEPKPAPDKAPAQPDSEKKADKKNEKKPDKETKPEKKFSARKLTEKAKGIWKKTFRRR